MLDMSTWPLRRLSVLDQVSLDPNNIRLDVTSPSIEPDIIADLLENEDVLSLVEGICRVGFLTHEVPIAIENESQVGRYVVVEGNRRLAALKVIQNANLAPQHKRKIETLSTQLVGRDELKEIDFRIAPNRDDADRLIAVIHTANQRRAWSPARQSAFFQAQLQNGRSYQELLERYPTANVQRFVLYFRLRERISNARVSDETVKDVLHQQAWLRGYSTLTRIFESEPFRAIVAPRLSITGDLESPLTPDQFDSMAEVILTGLREENLNTRTINTVKSPRFLQLIEEIKAATADRDSGDSSEGGGGQSDGSGDPKDAGTDGGADGGSTGKGDGQGDGDSANRPPETKTKAGRGKQPPPRERRPDYLGDGDSANRPPETKTKAGRGKQPPPRERRPDYLPVENLSLPAITPSGVRRIFEQLTILNVRRMPDLAHIALRAVLERTIKAFAEFKSEDIAKQLGLNKKFVQLDDALRWLEDYWIHNGPTAFRQPTARLRSSSLVTYTQSVTAMNASNHNHHFVVDHEDVWNLWDAIEGLLREMVKR